MAASLPVRPLGEQGLHASAQGLGCMSLTNAFKDVDFPTEQELITVIQKALTSGVSLLNTADLYGPYTNHVLIGKAIKNVPRDQVIISSKWGPMIDEQFNFTHNAGPENARKALQTTLKNLEVDYIDLYILRSKGTTHSIEDSVKGMAELVKEGLVKGIGLSEVSAVDIRKAHAIHPITAVEAEWSLFSRDAERDLIPTCRELGIACLAYSPMGRGMLTGNFSTEGLPAQKLRMHPRMRAWQENQLLVDKLKLIAQRKGCTAGQLALSWVHHQGDDVFPIPGTKRIKYLEENIAAFNIKLSTEDLAEIEEAIPAEKVIGDRYGMPGLTYHD